MTLEILKEHEKRIISAVSHQSNLFEYKDDMVHTSYFVGVDWAVKNECAIYVEPKINNEIHQTDYLKMLFEVLKHSETEHYTRDLFHINFEETPINIPQQQDMITPFLLVYFLGVVKNIVKKGLKKSYYTVEKNLVAKVKGKILIHENIKKNLVKNDNIKNYCAYQIFGFDNLENKLLKKTLFFIQKYLENNPKMSKNNQFFTKILHFVLPAFENVSADIEVKNIKNIKFNPFYKEYEEAIYLAKIILKRFGYNINKTSETNNIQIPPFWIDMSKLFELYVMSLLKDKFTNNILYQPQLHYGKPDFLLKNQKIIIDTKYKRYYNQELKGQKQWQRDAIAQDVRQLSGYARDKKLLEILDLQTTDITPCLIIYPNDQADTDLPDDLLNQEIKEFVAFYKLGIKLPLI